MSPHARARREDLPTHTRKPRAWQAAALAAALAAGTLAPLGATGVFTATPANAASEPSVGDGWTLATTNPFTDEYHPTFTGNGHFAARVPSTGQGFSAMNVPTQFQVAGLYASGLPNEARASAPAWSGLTVSDGSGTFDQAFSAPCVIGSSCQAEDAELSGGVSGANNHGGYQSSGFTQGWGSASAGARFALHGEAADGEYDLLIRYAAGNPGDNSKGDRALQAKIAGNTYDLTLPPSENNGWDTWMVSRVAVGTIAGVTELKLGCASDTDCRVNVDAVALVPRGADFPAASASTSLEDRGLSNYHQALDLKTGAITTSATWTSPAGRTTDVRYTVLTDRSNDNRAQVSVTLTPHWDGDLIVTDVLDTRPATFVKDTHTHRDAVEATIGLDTEVLGSGISSSIASKLVGPGEVAEGSLAGIPANSIAQQRTATVQSGQSYEFVKHVGLTTTFDGANTADLALAAAQSGAEAGAETVAKENAAAWAAAWKGDIRIDGDNKLQEQVRASRFYLLASASAKRPWSLSPAGLSSDGYGGHVFWDTETWMWPSLVAQDPDIAAAVLKYRSDRIEDAASNATASGQEGIRFPWEGALDGKEQTTATLFGETELHVTADVALAFWQYYLATGDKTWLAEQGWPVISGAADFWVSRSTLADDGLYHIYGVTPPDEWAQAQDDSAYTNVAAAKTMGLAAQAAAILGREAKPAWNTVAEKMFVPHDDKLGITPEYVGYNGGIIKQADVVMLTYPWGHEQDDALTKRNMDYYAGKVTSVGGPSMTDAIHSIVSSELGHACAAWDYTQLSADPFMRAPFNQFSEEREGGAFTFTTGAGGFLQEFYYGYTGLRMQQDGIELAPLLPPALNEISVDGLQYQGRSFDVSVGKTVTKVKLNSGAALKIHAASGDVVVQPGATVEIPTRTSTDCGEQSYGTLIGSISAPAGGDNGPGTYQYPRASAFPKGTFDMTNFDVYRDGSDLRFVTTVSGEITNPWNGNGMSVQLLHAYMKLPAKARAAAAESTPALPGTNVDTESPWDYVLIGNGRHTGEGSGTGLYSKDGTLAADVELAVNAKKHQIVLTLPESALQGADPSKMSFAVAMMSQASGNEGLSEVRPALDCTAPGTPDWVSEWRICGGKGSVSDASPFDTDTSDPNVLKIFTPEGHAQSEYLRIDGQRSILPFLAIAKDETPTEPTKPTEPTNPTGPTNPSGSGDPSVPAEGSDGGGPAADTSTPGAAGGHGDVAVTGANAVGSWIVLAVLLLTAGAGIGFTRLRGTRA